MISSDFFIEAGATVQDAWGSLTTTTKTKFNSALVGELRKGPIEGRTDLEAAIALAGLVHDELIAFGTDSSLNRPGFDAASFFVKDEAHVEALPGRAT